MDKELLYKKCVDFHGHSCGGLLIGFRAALCAMERFAITEPSPDEEIVCVAENDACGIDAVQALLGCTAGKGNLILRLRGKQAFTFVDRKSGDSFRIVLKEKEFASKRKSENSCAKPHGRDIQDRGALRPAAPGKNLPVAPLRLRRTDHEPWLRVSG